MDLVRGLDDLRSLLDAPSPAVLVTYALDGSAAVSPVWFRYTGEFFEVVVAKTDVKLRHLERDPRAELIIFEAVAPFRGVKIRADVELDDSTDIDEVRRAISARYLGSEAAHAFVAQRGPGVVVRLPASAARVWDLSRILPPRPGAMDGFTHARPGRPPHDESSLQADVAVMPLDHRPSDAERLDAIRRHAHDSLRYHATAALGGEDEDRTRAYLNLAANYMALVEGDSIDDRSMLEERSEDRAPLP